MFRSSKTKEEKVIDILLKYSGKHAANITAEPLEIYKANLRDIFARHNGKKDIEIILPGFPYKSANRRDKVLGKLPDLGEKCALSTLENLRKDIEKAIGIKTKMVICSDGFAFNDLKSIPDLDVLAYRSELRRMAASYSDITIKGLDDFMGAGSATEKRSILMDKYGTDIKTLKDKLPHDHSLLTLYNNLSAFAARDLIREDGESKKAFKRRCKDVAINVVARSRAWAGLIAEHHPDAIRLTIHPYKNVSDKFPVSLIPSMDGRWRTPWHNVPVICGSTVFNTAVKLAPKKDVEVTDAKLIYDEKGRASHYITTNADMAIRAIKTAVGYII